ncbi:LpqB family beta-propeller domain-containing protein [Kineococcus rhizosphaerae]|uniref:Sporulation and spore germination protein n=1 Tax=Kineococcus rhizosphaerae TaxID=559628 RepID=A0A2T0R073_9ACTN|nr:LpqB family beta-propeller domain-containing protein [Kineococcus rhizosphaerae]PRY12458.1 sporulation and spore germination protein [Kineococcus rhizosphaerae]
MSDERRGGASAGGGSRRRRWAALGLVVLLAGCGGVPRSGDVVSGSRVVDDPRIGLLQVIPDGPTRGAVPIDVVRGFLLAAASSQDDHAVAREFLTSAAAQTWRADASTTVVAAAPDLALVRQNATEAVVAVSATTTAVIDAAGHYVEQPPGTTTSRQLRLALQDGQWRVVDPGDGTTITSLDASRTLRPFPVYFVTGGPDPQLVGDVRWFGYDDRSTATRIVRALLEGASPWLAPGVVSGAPRGTQLRVGTVPVASGTATVDLSDAAKEADPEQRRLLLAQLRASLTSLPGVADVTVTVDGAEFSRADAQGAASGAGDADLPRATLPGDSRLVVLGPQGLSRWDRRQVQPVAGTGPGLESTGPASRPAAAPDADAYAVLTDEGRVVRVQAPGGPLQTAVSGRGPLVGPSIDRFGWVWTAPTAAGQSPVVVPVAAPETPASTVSAPADGLGGQLVDARVSRDGARLLVVVRDAAGAVHVRVHGIVRDVNGKPLRLGPATADLAPGAGDVLDAAWLVDDQFVLLARDGAGQTFPVLAEVSGGSSRLPPVAGGVSVAGGWTDRDVVVGTADGKLLVRSGADWIAVADGRDPAYPG